MRQVVLKGVEKLSIIIVGHSSTGEEHQLLTLDCELASKGQKERADDMGSTRPQFQYISPVDSRLWFESSLSISIKNPKKQSTLYNTHSFTYSHQHRSLQFTHLTNNQQQPNQSRCSSPSLPLLPSPSALSVPPSSVALPALTASLPSPVM